MSQDVTQPTDPSSRQCCCTSRSGAVLSYSPSQCQKKDLQNILGCISCADSDLMSPVRLIYTSREFQPRRLRFLLRNLPPSFLKFPLVHYSSFVGPFLSPPPRIMIGNRLNTLTLHSVPSSPDGSITHRSPLPFHADSPITACIRRTDCLAASVPVTQSSFPSGLSPPSRSS